MNRRVVVGLTLVLTAGASALIARETAARCSYFAGFPPAIGRHTFLLATAMRDSVTAVVDSPYVIRRRTVPAQIMQIDTLAGYRADEIRDGLRANERTAVFVRYHVGIGCGPWPAPDGGFDRK